MRRQIKDSKNRLARTTTNSTRLLINTNTVWEEHLLSKNLRVEEVEYTVPSWYHTSNSQYPSYNTPLESANYFVRALADTLTSAPRIYFNFPAQQLTQTWKLVRALPRPDLSTRDLVKTRLEGLKIPAKSIPNAPWWNIHLSKSEREPRGNRISIYRMSPKRSVF